QPAPKDGRFSKAHKVELAGGSPYTLELTSPDFDAALVLVNASGQGLTTAAATSGSPARVDFTPAASGVFHVMVTSGRPGQTGEYTWSVQRYDEARKSKSP